MNASPDLPRELTDHPKYRILKELGRGGMGVVYQAQHRIMEIPVALKVINRALVAHSDALERFQREVRAAAKLIHPNIVRALDADCAGDMHLLVMEFVEGVSLYQAVRKKGPLPIPHACHYVRQAALGLQCAHEQGMVHRDIKPHNLMLTPRGQVKILDFGLARLASEQKQRGNLTRTGEFMGTPDYVAPEQAMDATQADIRADVYSLGCTLYFLLTGRPPFQENTVVKQVLAHIEKQAVPLHEIRPDAPQSLALVVARMLAKAPAQRFQKPVEVAEALAPFCKAGSRPTGPPPLPNPGMRAARGEATVLPDNTPPLQLKLPKSGATPPAPAPVVPPHVETSPFAGIGEDSSPPLPKKTGRQRLLSGKALGCLAVVLGLTLLGGLVAVWVTGVPRRKPPNGMLVLWDLPADADVFIDGKEAAFKRGQEPGPIELPVEPGERKVEIRRPGFKDALHDITIAANQSLRINVQQDPWKDLSLVGHGGAVCSVAYSPDGKRIASGSADDTIKVWDANTGSEIHTLRGHTGTVWSVAYCPDGKRIVSGSGDNTIKVWDADTGREIHTLKGHAKGVLAVAFSPDGKRIVSGSWDQSVKVWDAFKGSDAFTFRGHAGQVIAVAYSPDGKRIASGSADNTVKVWDLDKNSSTFTLLTGHTAGVGSVAFSPDGKRIVSGSADQTVKVWDADTGSETFNVLRRTGISSVAYSPDGRRIVSAGADSTVNVGNSEKGGEPLVFKAHKGPVYSVAFSPDGTRIVSGGDDKTIKVLSVGRGTRR